jgi:hypothetical protein
MEKPVRVVRNSTPELDLDKNETQIAPAAEGGQNRK